MFFSYQTARSERVYNSVWLYNYYLRLSSTCLTYLQQPHIILFSTYTCRNLIKGRRSNFLKDVEEKYQVNLPDVCLNLSSSSC